MPSPTGILEGLTRIANDAFALGVLWHALLAALLLTLAVGWRPTARVLALLLCAPLASVSALAWAFGNPFNGLVFALSTAALLGLATRLPARRVALGRPWTVALGVVLVGLGWFYPHFLYDRPRTVYLYGAPLGLVPCPTLAVVVGLTLAAGGLGPRWSLALATLSALYALVGAAHLGVGVDLALLAGAVGLLVLASSLHRTQLRPALA